MSEKQMEYTAYLYHMHKVITVMKNMYMQYEHIMLPKSLQNCKIVLVN